MAQSLAKNLIHLIYSTKQRAACLDESIRPDLYAYKAGILQNWDSPAIIIGGMPDHIHVLFVLSKNQSLVKVVEEVKKSSSKWLKQAAPTLREFQWQNGYGAFSVSPSNVATVKRYIQNQEAHHRKKSFQEEFREFLQRHEVAFDEHYVWD